VKSSVPQNEVVAGELPQFDSAVVRLMLCLVEFGFVIAVMEMTVQAVLNW